MDKYIRSILSEDKATEIYLRPVRELYNPASYLSIRPRVKGYFHHIPDVVYAEAFGVGLIMDIFAPRRDPNGFGIIDVVSNGWFSDRHQFIQHLGLGIYDVFCSKGFHVFALSPGSIHIFNGNQMIRNVQAGIQYVVDHAQEYRIDPNQLCIVGISAGGHLAFNALFSEFLTEEPTGPSGKISIAQHVKAMGLFAIPSDLVSLYSLKNRFFDIGKILLRLIQTHNFLDAEVSISAPEIESRLKNLSPIYYPWEKITSHPSVAIFHGTKDLIIPFSQSDTLIKKMQSHHWDCEFVIKDNAPHIWKNMNLDFEYLAHFFLQRVQKYR